MLSDLTDLKSIFIIGAGPIVIGQACEFDYSGVQVCKALREEGYRVILINSNPSVSEPLTHYLTPVTGQGGTPLAARTALAQTFLH